MGCDIHAAIETRPRTNGVWTASLFPNKYFGQWEGEKEMTASLHMDRDYDVFAVLANVRNDRGFACCKTSSGFEPISDHRGLPENISEIAKDACDGDHSDTWVDLREILDYDWTRTTTKTGVVDAKEFEAWNRMKAWEPGPRAYCGGISGARIKMVTEDEMREHVRQIVEGKSGREWDEAIRALDENLYCQVEWEESYARAAQRFWLYPLPEMLKLGALWDAENVRLVMNFDS